MQIKQVINKIIKEELTKAKKNRLIENNSFSIDDFSIGDVIVFKNGEQWTVIKQGLRSKSYRSEPDEITVKPYNDIAKNSNVDMAIDINLDYLNKNVKKIIKK